LLARRLGNADTELLELARHRQAIAEGREDNFSDTWGMLFDAAAMDE